MNARKAERKSDKINCFSMITHDFMNFILWSNMGDHYLSGFGFGKSSNKLCVEAFILPTQP